MLHIPIFWSVFAVSADLIGYFASWLPAIYVVYLDLNLSLQEVAYSVLCCIFFYLFVGYSAPSYACDRSCTSREVRLQPQQFTQSLAAQALRRRCGLRLCRLCTFLARGVCMYLQRPHTMPMKSRKDVEQTDANSICSLFYEFRSFSAT